MYALDKYLAAAAEDRESARASREAADRDRAQQERDRKTMNRLTTVIMGATIVSAFATLMAGLATVWVAVRPTKAATVSVPGVTNVLPPYPPPIIYVTPERALNSRLPGTRSVDTSREAGTARSTGR